METNQNSVVHRTSSFAPVLLGLLFIVIGVLNMVLVHPVPGIFYLVLALIYFPFTDTFLKRKLGFRIHPILKIVLAFVVLWGTLAVGDLAEILGL